MFALAASLTLSATAEACTRTWAAGTGDWSTATNWSPPGVPGADDDVCLPAAAPYTVTLTGIVGSGVTIRSLTVGGDGPGSATLQLKGATPPSMAATAGAGTLLVSAGGSIGRNGSVVLLTTVAGGATLEGATIENAGSLVSRSAVDAAVPNYLRGSVINEPTGTLQFASDLVSDNGSVLRNLGAVIPGDLPNLGYWTITTGPHPTAAPTQIINSGEVDDGYDNIEVDGATWTQAGGDVGDQVIRISGGLLEDSAGTGRFSLGSSRLSGTIPAGQSVSIFGPLQLRGPVVTNNGELDIFPDPAPSPLTVVDGTLLDNAGTLGINPYGSAYDPNIVALRTDVHNEGVLTVGDVQLFQDAGTELDSSGLVDILATGQYTLTAPLTASRPSAFVNVAPGVVAFELGATSGAQIRLGPRSTMTASGGLAVQPRGIASLLRRRYDVVVGTGGQLTGAFTPGSDGFFLLTPGPNAISLELGQVATHVTGGRRSVSLTDACPPGPHACSIHVRATAAQRVSTWLGKGATRRRHTRAVITVVADVVRSLNAGETRVLVIRLNARGRSLVSRSRGPRTVTVAAFSDDHTILRVSVPVRP